MVEEFEESGLERLAKKYPRTATATSRTGTAGRYEVQQTFDSRSIGQQRVGSAPGVQGTETGQWSQDLARIQLDLADLADKYGKLGLTFNNLVGRHRIYNVSDALKMGFYMALMQKEKVKEIRSQAAGRHGNAIETLVMKMAEVISEQYEKAQQGKTLAGKLQVENTQLMKNMDRKLIESLKSSNYTGTDMALADAEVKKMVAELTDTDNILLEYESKIQAAKSAGNLPEVQKLSDEISKVLDRKYQVMDGRRAADGVVSEIRRQILDSAEGVQSAKGAIAASRVNYQAISALIDSMNELEIKYRHAKETMIPVFIMQGKIAAAASTAMDIKNTLGEVATISSRLLEVNANLVSALANETFELLKNPLYDVTQAKAIEERLSQYRSALNDLKIQWAEQSTRLDDLANTAQPGYAIHS